MTATAHTATEEGLDRSSPVALAYETTEEARLLLRGAGHELGRARTQAAEAAYFLSDTLEPEERAALLARAERRSKPMYADEEREERATESLTLLSDVSGEVERMLRGPSGTLELGLALRALRRASTTLTGLGARPGGARGHGSVPTRC